MKLSPVRFAFTALASLAIATSANAATILQFQQAVTSATPVLATPNAGNTATTLTIPGGSTQVQVSILGTPSQLANLSFTQPLTSGGPASASGNVISQDAYTGTIQFTSLTGVNILTVQFTGGLLTGVANGNQANFGASEPPTTVNFSSAVPQIQAAIAAEPNANFALAFSGLTSPLGIVGTTVRGFSASVSGTFSTSAAIPEPSSLVMASIPALMGLGFVGFRRRYQAS